MDKIKRQSFRTRLIIQDKKDPASSDLDGLPNKKSSTLTKKTIGSLIEGQKAYSLPSFRLRSATLTNKPSPSLSPLPQSEPSERLLSKNESLSPLIINQILPTIKEAPLSNHKGIKKESEFIKGSRSLKSRNDKNGRKKTHSARPNFVDNFRKIPDWLEINTEFDEIDMSFIGLSPVKNQTLKDEFSDLDFLINTSTFNYQNILPEIFVENTMNPNQLPTLKPTSPVFVIRRYNNTYIS